MFDLKTKEQWNLLSSCLLLSSFFFCWMWKSHTSFTWALLFWGCVLFSMAITVVTAESVWRRLFYTSTLIGGSLNALVILINGGRMPFILNTESVSVWQKATDQTHLLFLADVHHAFNHSIAYSVGDVFIFSAFVGLVLFYMFKLTNWIIRVTKLGLAAQEAGE